MSEIYRVWWVCVDLSEESLQDVSKWKLRNIKIAFREASKIVLWDEDMASARSRNFRDTSNKASIKELVDTIKRYVNQYWESLIDFNRAQEARKELDKCTWLNTQQKEKINITVEYIEIEWIKLRLEDETGTRAFVDGFTWDNEQEVLKDPEAPTKLEWQSIIDFLWWTDEQSYNFFREVLWMRQGDYQTSTGNSFEQEYLMICSFSKSISFNVGLNEWPEWEAYARYKYTW